MSPTKHKIRTSFWVLGLMMTSSNLLLNKDERHRGIAAKTTVPDAVLASASGCGVNSSFGGTEVVYV